MVWEWYVICFGFLGLCISFVLKEVFRRYSMWIMGLTGLMVGGIVLVILASIVFK